MDPEEDVSSGGRFETFDANAGFVVIRDDQGYGVWRLGDLGEGEPTSDSRTTTPATSAPLTCGQRSPVRTGAAGARGCHP